MLLPGGMFYCGARREGGRVPGRQPFCRMTPVPPKNKDSTDTVDSLFVFQLNTQHTLNTWKLFGPEFLKGEGSAQLPIVSRSLVVSRQSRNASWKRPTLSNLVVSKTLKAE